jgi:HEAT repeat protein
MAVIRVAYTLTTIVLSVLITGCKPGADGNAASGRTIQQWVDQATEPLEDTRPDFSMDTHGRERIAYRRRAEAFEQIETFGLPAIDALLELRADPERDISSQATRSLRNVGRKVGGDTGWIVDLLVSVLDHPTSTETRNWAADVLHQIAAGQPATVAMMTPLADRALRGAVVLDLGNATPRLNQAIPMLIEVADDKQGRFAAQAIKILGLIGPPAKSAVPVIVRQLQSTHYDVRCESAAALGRIGIGDREVIEALIASLQTEITGPTTGSPPGRPRGTRGANAGWRPLLPAGTLSKNVTVSLGQLASHPDLSIPALTTQLNSHSPLGSAARELAATSLSAFGEESQVAIASLVNLLTPRSKTQPILDALRVIDPGLEQTVDKLLVRLANPDLAQQVHAARVLAMLGDQAAAAAPALENQATGENEALAAWSAYALWKIDSARYSLKPALPVLIDVLKQPHSGSVNKLSLLADLAAAGAAAKPAVPAIITAIKRGDFGNTGISYLLKIDPDAALQAGLVTGLSPENLPTGC